MFLMNDRIDQGSHRLEDAARAAIERRADRTLNEAQWIAARRRLLAFLRILRDWDRRSLGEDVMLKGYASKDPNSDVQPKG